MNQLHTILLSILHINDYSTVDPISNHTLALSGSLFIISSWIAFAYENYITSLLSFTLSLTSVSYHLDRTFISFLLDQVALYSVACRSFIDGYNGGLPGFIIACIANGYTLFIYLGPMAKYMAFHPDRTIRTRWHVSIHVLTILSIIAQQPYITLIPSFLKTHP
jgi:hypothetical protein